MAPARGQIGDGCSIGPSVVVGAGVTLGRDVTLHAGAVVEHARLGDGVIVGPGSVVGSDGFGFEPVVDAAAPGGLRWARKEQTHGVVMEAGSEIGALCTVNRGSWRDTLVGDGCKLDSQVHIGHNVVLGSSVLICAQTGIAGSVTVGARTRIGGQVGVAQHVSIGSDVSIAAQSGVTKDVPDGATVGGSPAVPMTQYHRQTVSLAAMAKRKAAEVYGDAE